MVVSAPDTVTAFVAELRGRMVVGAGGKILGRLHDLVVDGSTWQITGLVIAVASPALSDLGMTKPFWSRAHVTVPVRHVVSIGDMILLGISIAEFASQLRETHPDSADTAAPVAEGGPQSNPT